MYRFTVTKFTRGVNQTSICAVETLDFQCLVLNPHRFTQLWSCFDPGTWSTRWPRVCMCVCKYNLPNYHRHVNLFRPGSVRPSWSHAAFSSSRVSSDPRWLWRLSRLVWFPHPWSRFTSGNHSCVGSAMSTSRVCTFKPLSTCCSFTHISKLIYIPGTTIHQALILTKRVLCEVVIMLLWPQWSPIFRFQSIMSHNCFPDDLLLLCLYSLDTLATAPNSHRLITHRYRVHFHVHIIQWIGFSVYAVGRIFASWLKTECLVYLQINDQGYENP